MAIRAGMTAVVASLRNTTMARTDDVFGGVTYWTDNQLQDILDTHKEFRHYPLRTAPYTVASGQEYGRHTWTPSNRSEMYEEDLATLWDMTGSADLIAAGTASVDFDLRLVTYLTAYRPTAAGAQHEIVLVVYDMDEAAHDVWVKKAAQREQYVRTKAGAHTLDLQMEWEHCVKAAARYRNKKIRSFKTPRAQRYLTPWTGTLRR